MDLDKKDIKALSADTRVAILKSLSRRRKMPAELSKEFGLAASTITEHLKHLEDSQLVARKSTGHKWIYYELTDKGSNVLAPKFPINIVLSLAGGILVVFGVLYQLLPKAAYRALGALENTAKSVADITTQKIAPQATGLVNIDPFVITLLVIGSILIVFGFYRKFKKMQ
ncbi:MAG TPA: winged helix-turn-helix domain-containing protein [archaeon]|nr:winged helix-turn-helix domain-containing protein [archaeon]